MSIASGINSGLSYVIPGYGQEGAPPGVAGAATSGQPVVYDPGTGLYLNTATGAVSTDPAGQQVVQDPSLATQAQRNFATSQHFLSQLGQYGAQYNQAQQGQTALAGELNNTITNPNAPSVARSQLEQGLGAIVQQQDAQAAGANGAGAALARQNAAKNIGEAGATENQQQGLLRANEVANAEGLEGQVLGQQANEAGQMTNIGTTAAGNFGQLAGGEQGNQESLTQSGGKNQLTTLGTIASAGGQAAAAASDVTEKDGVKPADMDDFLSKISSATGGEGGITYSYKHPERPNQSPGKKVGVPAQAVGKSKVGKHIVRTDAHGKLEMDHGEMMGAIIGALAHLHHKVKEVTGG